MLILLLALLLLGLFAALAGFISSKRGESDDVIVPAATCATCNGDSADGKCEQECMMEAATKDIEYYNDEELDKYAGRRSDSYNDEETEEFSEVLYTLRPDEVKGWNRSLILRKINIPDALKDELIMMIES